ncbi:MAG: type II secretion system protein GspG [Phycisphaerales bacterium]|nr:MAG: type II secretion system protein GspG [Phycisphaerales bacterium]
MSQYPYDPIAAPVEEKNGLGLAGFICSLVGLLVTGGLLCPIGLLISLIALGRRPRGFAAAGVIVGLIGTCGLGGLLIAALLIGVAAFVAGLAAMAGTIVFFEPEKMEITTEMAKTAIAVVKYREDNGVLPADLDLLDLEPLIRQDPWGSEYRYLLIEEEPGFDLISSGRDGRFGTEDDVHLTRLDEAWKNAFRDLDKKIEEFQRQHPDGVTITFSGQGEDSSSDSRGEREELAPPEEPDGGGGG